MDFPDTRCTEDARNNPGGPKPPFVLCGRPATRFFIRERHTGAFTSFKAQCDRHPYVMEEGWEPVSEEEYLVRMIHET